MSCDSQLCHIHSLRDLRGDLRSACEFRDNKAVVISFLGMGCPVTNLYVPRLVKLEKQFRSKRVQFVAVYPNAGDSLDDIAAHSYDRDVPFPVLKDFGQVLADAVGVTRVPTVVVLDHDFALRYHGRIDDQYGAASRRKEPISNYLEDALNAVLEGKRVATEKTAVDGCLVQRFTARRRLEDVTYSNDVARILRERCHSCHCKGGGAPFSLTSYEDAVHWAMMIKEVVSQRRMPPWHADARYGKFSNDRSMTQAEIDTVVDWIELGMPKGDNRELPAPAEWAGGWAIGEPDAVFCIPAEFRVPPTGEVNYQYFSVPTNFKEDRWVTAAEVKPSEPSVVHHVIVYSKLEGERLFAFDGNTNAIVDWAPGGSPTICPQGTALRIPKGAELLFEIHYTPNGIATYDRTSVGVIYAPEAPTREIHRNILANFDIQIPAGDPHYRAEATFMFRHDSRLLRALPHMHYRGKSFHYELVFADGREEILLSVPRWDFNWQTGYTFDPPVRIPRGAMLRAIAHWDNSRYNPLNPDSEAEVRFGLQTSDEMLCGWISYVSDRPNDLERGE